MIIGTVRELKNHEYRVGLTPENVRYFVQKKHIVLVEHNAGLGANYSDDDYLNAGAIICDSAKEIYEKSEMIVKVKEPIEAEYSLLRKGQILYTYLHLAANKQLAEVLMEKGVIGVGYETIEDSTGGLPCLRPMSEIAGRLSIQQGAKYIESTFGGKGILLGGVPGVERGNVVIVGGGVVGTYAAKAAVGMGANVTILDKKIERLVYLDDIFGASVTTLFSSESNIEKSLSIADLVIGAVLIPGGSTPKIIREEHVKKMKKGSVIVDIAIDQGGCSETSYVTTHDDPIYVKHGVVHYCVGNMPGVVPYTSTIALTNVTAGYAFEIANKGIIQACLENPYLAKGVNIIDGKCVNKNLSQSLNLEYCELEQILKA